jgi:excinuclease ABC subunit A
MGTPEATAAEPRSNTGQFLKELLSRRPGKRAQAAE